MQAWSELEAQYGAGPLTGEQGLVQATEASVASGAPLPDEAFSDLEASEGDRSQASVSAESFCHDNGSGDSNVEDGASQTCAC